MAIEIKGENDSSHFIDIRNHLELHIGTLDEAIRKTDYTLVGDIINFELVPCFQELFDSLNKMVYNEVGHDNNR
ncbi:hypothetical protein D3C73_860840 [compost metagenome]